jgi:hypothetical protein
LLNRATGIAIALIVAIVCTLLIYAGANKKYTEAVRTAKVLQATQFIPAGEKIAPGMLQVVDVPQQMAQDLAAGDAAGRYAKAPVMKDQLLMKDDLGATGRDPGYAEVYVPVDVPSSACVTSGDYADVYTKAANNNPSVLLYQKAEVLDVVDSNAAETQPGKSSGIVAGGGGAAVAIGIAVPSDQAAKIVGPASQKQIYLVKSAE